MGNFEHLQTSCGCHFVIPFLHTEIAESCRVSMYNLSRDVKPHVLDSSNSTNQRGKSLGDYTQRDRLAYIKMCMWMLITLDYQNCIQMNTLESKIAISTSSVLSFCVIRHYIQHGQTFNTQLEKYRISDKSTRIPLEIYTMRTSRKKICMSSLLSCIEFV
ncbi:unnamed protein product [Albugo candida]|uniref:Uncharacterized protein n=1 Tax=Albugo candida TaxID=65357 RepID=A0A024GTV3_9STRA|nr:unnamed protein product [Albugo candida]|eukprot:CCI50376.1 unnamed protein product [Albugo candida]